MGIIYVNAKQLLLGDGSGGSINWMNDTIKAVLMDWSWSPDDSLPHYSDIEGSIASAPQTLTFKTDIDGAGDAADVVFPTVPAGHNIVYLVVFLDTGDPATSPLILADNDWLTGPIVPDGNDVIISWDVPGLLQIV